MKQGAVIPDLPTDVQHKISYGGGPLFKNHCFEIMFLDFFIITHGLEVCDKK